MKKIFLGTILATLLIAPVTVSAQSAAAPTIDVLGVLDNLINWLFTILLIVAVIFLIIAAFNFITASGDPEKIKTARNFVLYALIGVAVAVAARGLVLLVRIIIF